MVRLFVYEGYEVKVSAEALALQPFKRLWDRDKSKDKSKAMQEFAYIYFFCDPRSDYQYLVDDKARHEAVLHGEGLPEKWKPDAEVKAAMEFYKSFVPASALLLQDTRTLVDKLRAKLRELDFDDVDVKALNTLTSVVKQIPSLVKMLSEAERAVTDQMQEQGEVRGSVEKTLFDDGLEI